MTLEEFMHKWRYKFYGFLSDSSVHGPKFKLADLMKECDKALTEMHADLAIPPGPIPDKVLAGLRSVFAAVKELDAPKSPNGVPAKVAERAKV